MSTENKKITQTTDSLKPIELYHPSMVEINSKISDNFYVQTAELNEIYGDKPQGFMVHYPNVNVSYGGAQMYLKIDSGNDGKWLRMSGSFIDDDYPVNAEAYFNK